MSKKDIKDAMARIDRLAQMMQRNSYGKSLVEFGILQNVKINLVHDMPTAGYYYFDLMGGHQIDLNADCDDYTLFASLAHELRHLEQYLMLEINTLIELPLEDAIFLQRIMEADASTYTQAVIYEQFKKTSDRGYLTGVDAYEEEDIRDAFISMITAKTDLNGDKKPYQAAFNQWFAKPRRVKHYDRAMIENYNEAEKGLVSLFFGSKKRPLTKKMLSSLGSIGPRFNYIAGRKGLDISAPIYKKKFG